MTESVLDFDRVAIHLGGREILGRAFDQQAHVGKSIPHPLLDQADGKSRTTQGTTASVHSHNVCRPADESGFVWFWLDWNCFYKFTLRGTNYTG